MSVYLPDIEKLMINLWVVQWGKLIHQTLSTDATAMFVDTLEKEGSVFFIALNCQINQQNERTVLVLVHEPVRAAQAVIVYWTWIMIYFFYSTIWPEFN